MDCKFWPGLAKIVEESGELNQVLGKIIANGGLPSYKWENIPLDEKMIEELGDVLGAIFFMIEHCPYISEDRVIERADMKYRLFNEWRNNSDG